MGSIGLLSLSLGVQLKSLSQASYQGTRIEILDDVGPRE